MADGAPTGRAVSPLPVNHHGIGAWAVLRLRAELGNWRLLLVRTLTAGVTVVVTVFLVPGLSFQHWRHGEFVLVGLVFGLLIALVKPMLQFLALRYLVVSYGLVLVLINAGLLWLLSVLLGNVINARSLLAALFGGLIVGVIGLLLDTIVGTTPPVLDRRPEPRRANE